MPALAGLAALASFLGSLLVEFIKALFSKKVFNAVIASTSIIAIFGAVDTFVQYITAKFNLYIAALPYYGTFVAFVPDNIQGCLTTVMVAQTFYWSGCIAMDLAAFKAKLLRF